MKKLIIILIGIVSFETSLFSQTTDTVRYIKPKNLKISGISLGSSIKQTKKIFGKPISVNKNSKRGDVYGNIFTIYYFDGVVAEVFDNEIRGISCSNPKYETADHVRVGDSINKLFKVYGRVEGVIKGDSSIIYYHIERRSECGFEFTISSGKITLIRILGDDD